MVVCGDLPVRCTGPACGGSADWAPGTVWISWMLNEKLQTSNCSQVWRRVTPRPFSSFSSKSLFSFLSMKREFLFLYLASFVFTLSDAVRRVKPFRAYQTKQTNSWTGNKKNGSTLCNSTRGRFYSNIWLEWESNPWPVSLLHSSQRTFFILF